MMDYYYAAESDAVALKAIDLAGGPAPEAEVFESVEAKDILACPHLELLIAQATGQDQPSLVPALRVVWPERQDWLSTAEPGASITALPDTLRDGLSAVQMTPGLAESWSGELWGFAPDHAGAVGARIIQLAKSAKEQGWTIYWWSEL